jgi:transketolase
VSAAELQDWGRLRALAARIKLNAVRMVAIQGFGYFGQAVSAAEIFAVLFGSGAMRPGLDRFVLSPGHYAVVLFATAAELGLIDRKHLESYGLDGALLEAVSTERTPQVDVTCGSLGQGLSGAIGLALASRYANDGRRVFAFLSDGEMEEGQVWEAAIFAAHHCLENLTVLIDANNSQVDGPITFVTTIEPIADKWAAFGWDVANVDGHDVRALHDALNAPRNGRPRVIVGRTQIIERLKALPTTADAHFVKLDPQITAAIEAELESQIA